MLGKHDNGEAAREELMKATGLTSIDIMEGVEGFSFTLKA